MNQLPDKDMIKRLPIGLRTVAHRIINSWQASKQDREGGVQMSKDKWITIRDIISR